MALGDDLEKANDEIQKFKEEIGALDNQLLSLGASIKSQITDKIKDADGVTQELYKSYNKDISSAITQSSKQLNNYAAIQKRVNDGYDVEAELTKEVAKVQKLQSITLRKIEFLKREGVQLNIDEIDALEETFALDQKILKNLKEQNTKQRESLGIAGKLADSVEGILQKAGAGGIAKLFNFKDAAADAAKENKKQSEASGKKVTSFQNVKNLSKSIFKNVDKAAAKAGFAGVLLKLSKSLVTQFLKADESTTEIARGLSMSKKEAKEFKGEMFESSVAAGLTGITIKEQKKAVMSLNKALGGTAIAFDKDIREGAAESLALLGLSEEAVGNMAKQAMITGKSFKALEKEQAKGVLDAEREFGIRLKLSDVLDESNKITGLARVNAMGIEGGLTKAVATAKSLGIEMSAVASSAGQLLDFESSIQNELQAELLIGRDLNLEKARAAALAGDQEALAKALVEEAGSLEELQGMNVIQQQALAGALGMSADQLADSLVNQEALSTQAQADLDRKAAEVLENEKALSITQMQTRAMDKFSEAVQMMGKGLIIGAAAAAALAIGLTFGAGAPLILAGMAAAGVAAYALSSTVEDGVAPPGKGPFTITDRFGATDITAAGDGIAVSPNINTQGGAGGNANMSETNMLLKQILSKEGTVQMDSTNVGTAFAVGSRQIQ